MTQPPRSSLSVYLPQSVKLEARHAFEGAHTGVRLDGRWLGVARCRDLHCQTSTVPRFAFRLTLDSPSSPLLCPRATSQAPCASPASAVEPAVGWQESRYVRLSLLLPVLHLMPHRSASSTVTGPRCTCRTLRWQTVP